MPSCRHVAANSGDSAIFDAGLAGGRIGCGDVVGGVGRGAVGAGVAGGLAGGAVAARDGARGVVGGASVAEVAEVTERAAVVVGVTACGRRRPIGGRNPSEIVAARDGVERCGTGSSAVRITKVSDTMVTAATRADVPKTGTRGSRTRQRVPELGTPWLSARVETSPTTPSCASLPSAFRWRVAV